MKRMILALILALPLSAMANTELNGSDVNADHSISHTPDPSAKTVVIHFSKDGTPLGVAHSAEATVKSDQLDKLAFAQMTLAAEDSNNLNNSTPASEKNDAQGTPQWGFAGGGFRGGGIYRGPNGGVAAWGGRGGFVAGGGGWGGGWGGGYGGGYAGWGGGYGAGYVGAGYVGAGYGYGAGYAGYAVNNCGYGGCGGCGGCGGYVAPTYYYSGCAYRPAVYYGGYADGGYYGVYQPAYY